MNNYLTFIACLIFVLVLGSCTQNSIPKPKGYYRIDFEEKAYINYEANCGFHFDVPTYGEIERFQGEGLDTCWFNISYPKHKAKLHMTYLPLEGNLNAYMEDSHQFAYEHEAKASAINTSRIDVPEHNTGCLLYDIEGDVATYLQIYLTDSVNHFLRGSLYFSHVPNEDSIAPVLSYLREDVVHMINTLEWDE